MFSKYALKNIFFVDYYAGGPAGCASRFFFSGVKCQGSKHVDEIDAFPFENRWHSSSVSNRKAK